MNRTNMFVADKWRNLEQIKSRGVLKTQYFAKIVIMEHFVSDDVKTVTQSQGQWPPIKKG